MSDLTVDTGIGDVASLVGKVIDKIFPDPVQAAQAKIALANAQNAGQLAELQAQVASVQQQTQIDNTEASSTSLFVSGWRPFIGWVCGGAVALNYFLPLCGFVLNAVGHPTALPPIDMTTMMPLLFAMLGLGGMRTYEKVKGVNPVVHG